MIDGCTRTYSVPVLYKHSASNFLLKTRSSRSLTNKESHIISLTRFVHGGLKWAEMHINKRNIISVVPAPVLGTTASF